MKLKKKLAKAARKGVNPFTKEVQQTESGDAKFQKVVDSFYSEVVSAWLSVQHVQLFWTQLLSAIFRIIMRLLFNFAIPCSVMETYLREDSHDAERKTIVIQKKVPSWSPVKVLDECA